MAKFCGNCGAKLDDSAKVCGNCGTPLDGAVQQIPKMKVENPERRKKIKKIVATVAVVLILALASRIGVGVVSQYTGYNGLLRKVMTAYKEFDIETIVSLSSSLYYYGNDDSEDWAQDYFEHTVGDDLDAFDFSVGHSYKLTYKVNEIYPLKERRKEEVLDMIETTYPNFDVSEIKKIVVANVTLTAKEGKKIANKNVKIGMSKEDGAWKVLYIE